MREFLEFHDSTLLAVEQFGGDLRVELLGYVHRWAAGEGTGWTFKTSIVLRGGTGAVASTLPIDISDGTLSVGALEIQNMVELPFASAGACQLVLVTAADGKTHVLTGEGIQIARGPEGKFIETLPAAFNPDGVWALVGFRGSLPEQWRTSSSGKALPFFWTSWKRNWALPRRRMWRAHANHGRSADPRF